MVLYIDEDGDLMAEIVWAYTAGIAEILVEGQVVQVMRMYEH